jgi:hypothetical protein
MENKIFQTLNLILMRHQLKFNLRNFGGDSDSDTDKWQGLLLLCRTYSCNYIIYMINGLLGMTWQTNGLC